MNLASEFLRTNNETLADYDGICGELAGDVMKVHGGDLLYIEGDIPWRYHMALLLDGLVHDGWYDEALPLRDYLIRMFGARAEVELSVNGGDPVFVGQCRDFNALPVLQSTANQ